MSTAPNGEIITAEGQARPPFLRRVRIRGYKSIAYCDVTLEPLTILVGRNASGKSNFLDALAFLRDAMDTNITEAARRHGGWQAILSRASPDGEVSFDVEVSLLPAALPTGAVSADNPPIAEYGFALIEGQPGFPVRIREWFRIKGTNGNGGPRFDLTGAYDRKQISVKYRWDISHPEINCNQVPYPRPDLLWLTSLGREPFLGLSTAFRSSGYYNFQPQAIRQPQRPTLGAALQRDGENLASVIASVREIDPSIISRVGAYLSAIVSEVERFEAVRYGDHVGTIRFQMRPGKEGEPLVFDAASMSDGTLRALGSLMAAFQIHLSSGPTVVGIEEPETALHPAAMRALVDALDEATLRTQIILTTHSADMLDNPTLRPENIRVVQMLDGQTMIAPVDEAGVDIVRRNLNTLGGLERDGLLEPDLTDLNRQRQGGQARQETPA